MFGTIDTNGIIIACNRSYAYDLGFTKDEVIGASIFDHVYCSSIPAMKDSFDTWKKIGSVTVKSTSDSGTIFVVRLLKSK